MNKPERLPLFAVACSAFREVPGVLGRIEIKTQAAGGRARSEDEAYGTAMRQWLEVLPPADGWRSHNVHVYEIKESTPTEAT